LLGTKKPEPEKKRGFKKEATIQGMDHEGKSERRPGREPLDNRGGRQKGKEGNGQRNINLTHEKDKPRYRPKTQRAVRNGRKGGVRQHRKRSSRTRRKLILAKKKKNRKGGWVRYTRGFQVTDKQRCTGHIVDGRVMKTEKKSTFTRREEESRKSLKAKKKQRLTGRSGGLTKKITEEGLRGTGGAR